MLAGGKVQVAAQPPMALAGDHGGSSVSPTVSSTASPHRSGTVADMKKQPPRA